MAEPVQWLRLYDDVLDDPKVQRLSAKEFREELMRALRGEASAFDGFVEGPFEDNNRPPSHEWRRLRELTFARDDYTCQYCGIRGARLECDHIVPVARGGTHDPENLTTACFPCNRSKRDKLVEEWKP